MPWVLTQKLHGERYNDRLGTIYRIPDRWCSILPLAEGDRLVNFRPTEGQEGKCHLGSGFIDAIDAAPENAIGRISRITNFKSFDPAVPVLLANSDYAETGNDQRPAFRWSNRFITQWHLDLLSTLAMKATGSPRSAAT